MPITPGQEEIIQGKTSKDLNVKEGRVWVYKYDNSLQCKMGIPLSLEKTEKELKDIEVFAREKRHDGLARTQICGSPTGLANAYQIENKDLAKARQLGFRVWDY